MIVSFYSYKGGVGRTQLVANLAAYLCFYQQNKVLLIDWDLDAPGLHFYFQKQYKDLHSDGLIELLHEYMMVLENEDPYLPAFDKSKHVVNLLEAQKHLGKVDLIPAGNYNHDYTTKVNEFDWNFFWHESDGKEYVEHLKLQINEMGYDYVLIDSRTGIADYSGIANIQLPDANVMVVYPNQQNFDGTLRVAKSIVESEYVKAGWRKPIILPVLSKVDQTNDRGVVYWRKQFVKAFGRYLYELSEHTSGAVDIHKTPQKETGYEQTAEGYADQTTLFYKTDLAFSEKVLFNERTSTNYDDQNTLEQSYAKIAEYILSIKPTTYTKLG